MLRNTICLGIAGNFAHHLEQAGEASDFVDVVTDEAHAPKGIFPFYLPGNEGFLGVYPISKERLVLPDYEANAQVEPEIGILFDVTYGEDHFVTELHPRLFTVFNDTTIRKEGALKISEKKSWHEHSKGKGNMWVEIDRFEPGGIMDRYRLHSFLVRDGVRHAYGVDAPLTGYSYFHGKLLHWLIDRINHQTDTGPLEDIRAHFAACGHPSTLFVTIGATEYAPFGQSNYLRDGDLVIVEAYDTNDLDHRITLTQQVVSHERG
jgi:hypothetical protein